MKWLVFAMLTLVTSGQSLATEKLRIGVAGLTHTHVHWIFESEKRGDIEIVGIAEANQDLARRYSKQHGYPMEKVYPSLEAMLTATKPNAVTAFGTIHEHLAVVEAAAPRGIHVMVEKPLAINMQHAEKMYELAKTHNIHLLTNYETTWYASNHAVKASLKAGEIGPMRKLIVRDGHRGPVKLGINQEFLDWLLDPAQNGGGAIVDFGCYGANLATWLKQGEIPQSVTAVTAQLQPDNHPDVDDEATIILSYPDSQVIIQASWNWPIGRKDMEVYGETGVLYADNAATFRKRIASGYDDFNEINKRLRKRPVPLDDPFSYFKAVIQGQITPEKFDLSSLENNMIVMRILDAARQSAATGQRVALASENSPTK
ncbi:Gfo/Idh/MocA family protein [Alteromonas ponticola]|uniref:Gfo/Idh/MocA family oxidoreductase n=1 Tax=Alteromonas ponticola TaxID=2720613 RepID=A0ABX1R6H5_9ALTE|nr:Gfo/Idh/MocA family oxidoreductase [Alteromonas ponticola]NMH60727.1 Gfo/Idh/MocA family oxidoreductase [Alteromonas ponticola]